MKLKITIENKTKDLDVPEDVMIDGESFFQKMDKDMDRGWQMGQDFIEKPTLVHRCQIAAEKILQAIDTQNEKLLMLMAGYILVRMPDVTSINIDTSGEPQGTEFTQSQQSK